MNQSLLLKLHSNSIYNSEFCRIANKCGCFYCLSIFPSSEVTEFWDSQKTAVCPKCGIDSLLFDSQDILLTETLLRQMQTFAWNGYITGSFSGIQYNVIEVD